MRSRSLWAFPIALFVACAGSCTSTREGRTKMPDGSYELACKKPLGDCLTELTDVCNEHGYDVVRAKQEIYRNGVEPVNSTFIDSHATIRCRSASTLFGGGPPVASASPSSQHAPTRCFPGATQACLGPGACKGAQTCQRDGTHFGPCDCGNATPPPVAPPLGAADAGPAPTVVAQPDGGAPP